MSFQVAVKGPAEKELRRIAPDFQRRIAAALIQLAENPLQPGVKKLRGSDAYRIRVGDYRILYTFDAQAKRIEIYAIGHRKEVYR